MQKIKSMGIANINIQDPILEKNNRFPGKVESLYRQTCPGRVSDVLPI